MRGTFNKSQFKEFVRPVSEQWEIIDEIISEIVADSISDLDEYLSRIQSAFTGDSSNLSNEDLETIIFEIPLRLYWATDNMEIIGVKEDIAKIIKSDKYRAILMETGGTSQVKQSSAETACYQESLINIIYSNAYKLVKIKCDMAFELMQSAKKIFNKRISEIELSGRGSRS